MDDARDLYIDLLKKTLTFSLWPEPGVPIEQYGHRTRFLRTAVVFLLSKLFGSAGIRLVRNDPSTPEDRAEGRNWPGYADTMIGMRRLENLQRCVESVIRESIPGDFIETGVWRGGACIFMRAVLKAYGIADRSVFVADSFAGLPPPDGDRYPEDRGDIHHTAPLLSVSRADVENNFRKYGLLDEQVVFLQGWFKDTLPNAPVHQLAVLRLDGDMYGSTMEALQYLYPKLSAGGYCIIDDFGLQGCRRAVDDYREENGITDLIEQIDWLGAFWRKK